MEVLVERCAGIDIGKDEVVACVRTPRTAGRGRGKQTRTFIIILSPVVQMPVELEKHLIVIEHELPDRVQLLKIAQDVATEAGELPPEPDLQRVLDAAAGLTCYEAEGAFSLSLVRHGKLEPQSICELKSGLLKKSGLLQLHRGSENHEKGPAANCGGHRTPSGTDGARLLHRTARHDQFVAAHARERPCRLPAGNARLSH